VIGSVSNEGSGFRQKDLRQVQGDSPQGSRARDLHESEAQAETEIVTEDKDKD
jgi:hypothetical protein